LKRITIAVFAILIGTGTIYAQTTNTFPAPTLGLTNNIAATKSHSVTTSGPIQIITSHALGAGLSWIAQHGSAGYEYCGPVVSGKNNGNGSAATETALKLDVAWVSQPGTNVDLKAGIMHSDVITKSATVDQFGFELDEAFFNQNLVQTVSKVP